MSNIGQNAENAKNELKVFFITSNQKHLDEKLQYTLEKRNGMSNLIKMETIPFRYDNRENFTIKIFSFEIKPSELLPELQDKTTKKYRAKIHLIQKRNYLSDGDFIGYILFKNNKNNFIYDFKFENRNTWLNSQPPVSLNLNLKEQFVYYAKLLKKMKIKIGDDLAKALVLDTENFFFGKEKEFYLDFFLEVFKMCFKERLAKPLLITFKPDKVKIPKKMNKDDYSGLLNLISKNIKIITNNSPGVEKFFYTLLLFFKMHFEKETIPDLLKREEIWQYYSVILIEHYNYFKGINLSDKLLDKLLQSNNFTFDKLLGLSNYIHSFEKMLIFINQNCEIIFKLCKEKKTKIKISDFIIVSENDNFSNIIKELTKLIEYQ